MLGTRRFPDQCFAAFYRSGGIGDEDHDVDVLFGREMRDGGTADVGDADVGGIGGGEIGADLVGEEGEVAGPGSVGREDLNRLRRRVWRGNGRACLRRYTGNEVAVVSVESGLGSLLMWCSMLVTALV